MRRNGIHPERGQSMVFIAISMVVLLGFTGLAIDVGFGLLQKRRLQSAVDLGLLSGAQDLPNATAAAAQARSFVADNFGRVSTQPVTVATSTGCMQAGCADHDKLTVQASTATPTFFVKLFGIDSWDVGARGSACGPCDSSPFAYDVVVVLDRSFSMCMSASGSLNGCADIANAKQGIRELLDFFDPDTDRVALAVLSSADTNSCAGTAACPSSTTYGRPFSHTNGPSGYSWVTSSAAGSPYCNDSAYPYHAFDQADQMSGSQGAYFRSAGDFMDGDAGNHDRWVLVDLEHGEDFKRANGTLNEDSAFLNTLDCVQHKYWTPIAPAIYEATEELDDHGRETDDNGNPVTKVIVFFGDGGGTAQPVRRNNSGTPTTTLSWYTPTAGNNNRPCHDAVAQAARARSLGIRVYTIGYALGEGDAMNCRANSTSTGGSLGAIESGIDARRTMRDMADGPSYFFEQVGAGDVRAIFQAIGHSIVTGGTRLVE